MTTTAPARTVQPGQRISYAAVTGTVTAVRRMPGRGGTASYRIVLDTGHGLETVTVPGTDAVALTDQPADDTPPTATAPDQAPDDEPQRAADAPDLEPLPTGSDLAPQHPFDLLDTPTPRHPPEGSATDHRTGERGVVADSLAHVCQCRPVAAADIARMVDRDRSFVTNAVKAGKLPEPRWRAGKTSLWCLHDVLEIADRYQWKIAHPID